MQRTLLPQSALRAFDTATTFATVSPSLQLRVGDADGDDQGDLIYRNQSTGEVFVRRFDGSTFTSAGYWGSWDPQRSFDAADADGDERADMVGWHSTSGEVYVSLTTVAIPEGPPVQAYTADPDVVYDDEDIVASSAASGAQALAVPPSPIPRLAFQDDGVLVDRRGLSAIRAEADQQIQRLYDRIIEVGATVVRFNVIWGRRRTPTAASSGSGRASGRSTAPSTRPVHVASTCTSRSQGSTARGTATET